MPALFDIMMDPKKYGYMRCPHCNGYGSSLKEGSDRCSKCSGSGLVKKPIEINIELDAGGWHVVWFNEETDLVSVWYAGRVEDGRKACEERAKEPLPPAEDWCSNYGGGSPRYDRER